MDEAEAIRQRYSRRDRQGVASRYDMIDAPVYMAQQEFERSLVRWIRHAGLSPLSNKRVLDIGCGRGDLLLEFIRLGFSPENLVGVDLLTDRVEDARRRVACSTRVLEGDACNLDLGDAFDVVVQSTVFSSLLDLPYQERLARSMWASVKPGGGILWYDFIYRNPANPDVIGVPVRRVRELFPAGVLTSWKLTLAPPLSRRVARLHPVWYTVLNGIPLLRTHVLCWILKPVT